MTEVDLPAAVDAGLLIIRALVGAVFAGHGFQKLFGWFGGGGLDGTGRWFASLGFGDGRRAALMAGSSEIAGGLGLALGFLTPVAAAAMIGTMTTAAFVNHASKGFWSAGNGWELNGYLIVVPTAVAIIGPGTISVDHALGLDVLWGVVPGVLALLVGFAGGAGRWFTRDRGDEDSRQR